MTNEITTIDNSLIARTERSLAFTRKPTWEEADLAVNTLERIKDSIDFWTGDLANYLEHCFGDDYVQLFDTNYAESSIGVYKWVCASIAPNRRRKELSKVHHTAVAGVED